MKGAMGMKKNQYRELKGYLGELSNKFDELEKLALAFLDYCHLPTNADFVNGLSREKLLAALGNCLAWAEKDPPSFYGEIKNHFFPDFQAFGNGGKAVEIYLKAQIDAFLEHQRTKIPMESDANFDFVQAGILGASSAFYFVVSDLKRGWNTKRESPEMRAWRAIGTIREKRLETLVWAHICDAFSKGDFDPRELAAQIAQMNGLLAAGFAAMQDHEANRTDENLHMIANLKEVEPHEFYLAVMLEGLKVRFRPGWQSKIARKWGKSPQYVSKIHGKMLNTHDGYRKEYEAITGMSLKKGKKTRFHDGLEMS